VNLEVTIQRHMATGKPGGPSWKQTRGPQAPVGHLALASKKKDLTVKKGKLKPDRLIRAKRDHLVTGREDEVQSQKNLTKLKTRVTHLCQGDGGGGRGGE